MRGGMSVQTRSRSDKNAAARKAPKDGAYMPAFLNGLHRHTAPLHAVSCKTDIYAVFAW